MNKHTWPNYSDLRKPIPILVEQPQAETGKYLSGQCEWNFALGLKDTVN